MGVVERRKYVNRFGPSQPCKAAVERTFASESDSSQVLYSKWGALLAPSLSLEFA